jgi:membrane fusion protein (multidrug efflux system)
MNHPGNSPSFLSASRPFRPARTLLSAALVLAAMLLPACRGEKAASAPPPPTVEVARVIRENVPVYQEWVATADGMVNATLRAQVTGYLVRQAYREGDFVRKGQLLFEIDPRPFQAALDQSRSQQREAEGALAQAEGRVAQAEGQLAQAEGQLAQSGAQHVNAKATLDRVRPLVAQNAVSRKDLDDAVGAEGSARAGVVAATANVAAARANLVASRANVSAAQAGVEAARANVAKAALDLGFTRITSPIDGIAGIASAQVGNLVGPGQGGELATVSQIDPVKVYFSTSEQLYLDYVKQYASGAEAARHRAALSHELVLADGSVYPYKGSFFAVDRQVDERTGTLRIAVLFPNPDRLIRPGQFARVRVAMQTKQGALLVPQRAVTELQGGYQVAVVGPGNRAELRTVKPAERVCALWVVDEGLKPDDLVVVEGIQKVKQGLAVTPKPLAPALLAKLAAPPDADGRCTVAAR